MATQSDEGLDVSSNGVWAAFNPLRKVHAEDFIFHYCSPETLLAILKNRTVRFGDALHMNDGEEVTWGIKQLHKAVQRLRDRDDIAEIIPSTPKQFFDMFVPAFGKAIQILRQMVACFSTSGDSLSQWRAYASDGRGFSVGYKQVELEVPAQLLRVCYDTERQQDYLVQAISAACENWKKNKKGDTIFYDALTITGNLVAFKNPAFSDESEVRLSYLAMLKEKENGHRRIEALPGRVFDEDISPSPLSFITSRGSITSYLEFPMAQKAEQPIKEIWLGPKCASSVDDIDLLLGTLGYKNVEIKVAGNFYR